MSLLIAGSEVQGLLPRYCYSAVGTRRDLPKGHWSLVTYQEHSSISVEIFVMAMILTRNQTDRTTWIICERTYQGSQAGAVDSTYSTIISPRELFV